MPRGLWKLTWLEIKIFVREPLGLIGTLVVPVLVFVALGRWLGPRVRAGAPDIPRFVSVLGRGVRFRIHRSDRSE